MEIAPGKLQVDAIYRFVNPGSTAWKGRIGYPVAVTPSQPSPDAVTVGDNRMTPVRCRAGNRCAAVLDVEVQPGRAVAVRVRYDQVLKRNRAVYMVTSARRWKQPIGRAEFEIRVPLSFTNVRMSYPHKSPKQEGRVRVFRIFRKDFMPDRELTVTWDAPAPDVKLP